MSIAAAYMVPHPPMIVPQVGRGSENQVLKTIQAYEAVASEIAEIKPETIIVTSPHSVLYADYFHISPGDHASGKPGSSEISTSSISTVSALLTLCDSSFARGIGIAHPHLGQKAASAATIS